MVTCIVIVVALDLFSQIVFRARMVLILIAALPVLDPTLWFYLFLWSALLNNPTMDQLKPSITPQP